MLADLNVFLPQDLVRYPFDFTSLHFSFSDNLSSCKSGMKMHSGKLEKEKDLISDVQAQRFRDLNIISLLFLR